MSYMYSEEHISIHNQPEVPWFFV